MTVLTPLNREERALVCFFKAIKHTVLLTNENIMFKSCVVRDMLNDLAQKMKSDFYECHEVCDVNEVVDRIIGRVCDQSGWAFADARILYPLIQSGESFYLERYRAKMQNAGYYFPHLPRA